MALTEEKVLSNVEVCVEASAIQVKWINRILRDGQVISQLPHRAAYIQGQKEQFVADIENPANGGAPGMAAPYIEAIGW